MGFFKKYGFLVIKWLIFTASILFLAQRIAFHNDFNTFLSTFTFSIKPIFLLISVFLLMFLNWGLEAYKWKLSVKNISHVSLKRAIAAVFAGTAISLFMPNRTGEFVGRIFALPKEKRAEGIVASIVISFAQLNITLLFGLIATFVFFYLYPENILTQKNISYLIIIPLTIVTVLSFALYIKIQWFEKPFSWFKFLNKYAEKAKTLSSYSSLSLLSFLIISIARYSVFLIQFHLLVLFFGLNVTFVESILSIILTFYVSTIIPTFSLTEIGVRGSAAVLFFGFFSQSYLGIISASTLLWIINVGTPALIGNYFVARFKENY